MRADCWRSVAWLVHYNPSTGTCVSMQRTSHRRLWRFRFGARCTWEAPPANTTTCLLCGLLPASVAANSDVPISQMPARPCNPTALSWLLKALSCKLMHAPQVLLIYLSSPKLKPRLCLAGPAAVRGSHTRYSSAASGPGGHDGSSAASQAACRLPSCSSGQGYSIRCTPAQAGRPVPSRSGLLPHALAGGAL